MDLNEGEFMYGTQEEWDALTEEEQRDHWESFEEQNMAGTADDLYFYEVMMAQHLRQYVGH